MAVIRVPKTPKRAFNPNRPASALLKSQIQHLEWAIRPASQRKAQQLPTDVPATEGKAADRIAQLTQQLHPTVPVPPTAQPSPSGGGVYPPSAQAAAGTMKKRAAGRAKPKPKLTGKAKRKTNRAKRTPAKRRSR
jgi:hypothetical protein